MSESKEVKAVKAAMGITEKPANETSAAGNEQNQENGKTTEAKPANGKGREEQKQVIQPKVLEIGKKQPAKPGKEVTPSKEEQAKQEQAKQDIAASSRHRRAPKPAPAASRPGSRFPTAHPNP